MIKLISHITLASALAFSLASQATPIISSYDISNAEASGFGGWSNAYSGTITATGGGLYSYTGGSGTLNDGITPTNHINNQLFTLADNSTITLHLNTLSNISELNILGGAIGNMIPGTLTGATITIGALSVALSSTAWGATCSSGLCNDKFSLAGSGLDLLATNTITLSNFTGGWSGYYNIGEVTVAGVNAAVPAPATFALLGLGLVGLTLSRRRKI